MLLFAAVLYTIALGQEEPSADASPDDLSDNYTVEIVLGDLDNPYGLAVRNGKAKTGPHELFLAESGAGRVVRLTTDQPENIAEAIIGFPLSTYDKAPAYRIGPLGLLFLTRTKLIVGGGGLEKGKELVRVYALPIDGSTLTADQMDHSVGPIQTSDRSTEGVENFFSLAKTGTAVFVTSGGDDPQGWILKAGIEANRLEFLQPRIATIEASGSGGAPTGLAVIPKPRPQFLVVAQRGSLETPHDSQLSFYVPTSGTLALQLPTGLNDIVGLAYSPSGQLYALDFSWRNPAEGGVYRLDDARVDGKPSCRAMKIASATHPTALAFTPEGTLYVTALGEGENTKQGVLLKITGDL